MKTSTFSSLVHTCLYQSFEARVSKASVIYPLVLSPDFQNSSHSCFFSKPSKNPRFRFSQIVISTSAMLRFIHSRLLTTFVQYKPQCTPILCSARSITKIPTCYRQVTEMERKHSGQITAAKQFYTAISNTIERHQFVRHNVS